MKEEKGRKASAGMKWKRPRQNKTSQNRSQNLLSSFESFDKSVSCARKTFGDDEKIEKKEEGENVPFRHHDRGSHIGPSKSRGECPTFDYRELPFP